MTGMVHRRFLLALVGIAATIALVACTPQSPTAPPIQGNGQGGVVYNGLGFDACAAPSTSSMTSWLNSPYREIGVYIGGASRACSQPNLTSAWVSGVVNQGWFLLPIWVGPQAPAGCTSASFSHRISSDPYSSATQGIAEANSAASAASALGLKGGSPIYYDLEGYNRDGSTCSTAVRVFVSNWVGTLHADGYSAGFYSSAASGIADQVENVSSGLQYYVPDQMWFAHWNGNASPYGDSYIPDQYWTNHQRHHQYHGGQNETYGGVTINIDGDGSDGLAVGPAP
jgi:hypothetical protein